MPANEERDKRFTHCWVKVRSGKCSLLQIEVAPEAEEQIWDVPLLLCFVSEQASRVTGNLRVKTFGIRRADRHAGALKKRSNKRRQVWRFREKKNASLAWKTTDSSLQGGRHGGPSEITSRSNVFVSSELCFFLVHRYYCVSAVKWKRAAVKKRINAMKHVSVLARWG